MKLKPTHWKTIGLGALCLAASLAVVALVLRGTSERLLQRDAEHSALEWAQFVGSTVDNIEEVFAGKGVTDQGLEDLRHVRQVQEIFRFRLFDPKGRLVVNSEALDHAGAGGPPRLVVLDSVPVVAENAAVQALLSGAAKVIELRRSTETGLPAVYSDAYVPVRLGGRLLGFVEVYVDQVEREQRIQGAFAVVAVSVLAVFLVAAGLVTWRWLDRLEFERAASARIRYLAHHDVLSGALNRASFAEALKQAVWRHESGGPRFSVLCINLDHFKELNDTLGHAIGDEVLRNVGERMRDLVRHGDCVARLGSDEFAILQTGVAESADVGALAQRVVDTLALPHDILGRRVQGSGSVGAAIFGVDAIEADELMQKADLALSRAKAAGRHTFSFYDAVLDEQLQGHRLMARDLRAAIGTEQILLNFQPLYAPDGSTLHGYEALLRWNHPTRGPVSPAVFIPMAEDAGLIDEIGRWALRAACAEAMHWPEHLTVAVNLSVAQFNDGELLSTVAHTLAETGLPAARLELEITESLLMSNTETVVSTLNALAHLGVRTAMDDFGTGYSSLAYLWRFPFNKLKIDRAFTQHLGRDSKVDLIVKSIVTLAHSLGIRVNAEGVETTEQMAALRRVGCDELQGFLLGRPAPAADLAHLKPQLQSAPHGQPHRVALVVQPSAS